MKAIVNTKTLKAAVDKAAFAVEAKATLPILGNLLISCDKDKQQITITGTDLENTVSLFRTCNVPESGAFTVNAKAMKKIMASIDDISTTIFHDDDDDDENTKNMLTVNDYKLVGMPADEFPVFPSPAIDAPKTQMVSLPISAIEKVRAAISTDEARYYLNGIFLDHGAITATDGHRLHTAKHSTGMQAPELDDKGHITNVDDIGAIVPAAAVKLLARASYKKDYTGQGLICGNHIYLGLGGDDFLMAKLIDGDFPEYSQVIPGYSDGFAIIEKKEFTSALKAAMAVSGEMNNGVKIALNGSIQVSSSNPDLGTFSRTVPGEWSEHTKELVTGFNARYMLDALAQVDGDQAMMEVSDNLAPALFSEGAFRAVVMPMRL